MELVSPLESTYAAGSTHDVPLGDFLKRPVEIFSTNIPLNDQLTAEFDPWSLFLLNNNVQRRLEGFRHIRGHLKVRAVLNGNPFLYGRNILWYEPRPLTNMYPYPSRFSDSLYISASQHPHIYLDPTTSQGGEMILPFFCDDNWLDYSNSTSIPSMGRLHLDTIERYKHANSTTGKAELRIYAWMEDAEICTPTATVYGSYTYQSERSKPQISKMASRTAAAAGLLSRIPALEPYAMATETVAGTISKIAHIFGFSRPSILQDISRYRDLTGGVLSTTDEPEVVERLGLDSQGELTVDPRTVGLPPVDEMAISHLVGKENIIHRADWDESAAAETLIASINVTPFQFKRDTNPTVASAQLTSQMAVAMLFGYWKGSITYRMQVIASAMHRGRLRIVYEPTGALLYPEFNQVYSRVIDIETCRDVEIPIKWHAPTPWIESFIPDLNSSANFNVGTSPDQNSPEYFNGRVSIYVLNPLTSPDPDLNQPIHLLFSQRCEDDFRFARPTNNIQRLGLSFRPSEPTQEPQSFMAYEKQAVGNEDSDDVPEDASPSGGEPLEAIGEDMPPEDHIFKVFMGEAVPSLRTLLRRYTSIGRSSPPNTVNVVFHNRGVVGRNTGVFYSPIEYVNSMYVAWRGSMRYKCLTNDKTSLIAGGVTDAGVNTNSNPTPNLTVGLNAGWTGMASQYGSVQVEVPFYSNKRFNASRQHPTYAANVAVSGDNSVHRIVFNNMSGDVLNFYSYQATGEDYTNFFHIGLPPVYAGVDGSGDFAFV